MRAASLERESFSMRLMQALHNAQYPADSATQLARNFNIRFSGTSITVHAARKWLVGEAIPTQEKMRVLADWLVVPAEWLRFGAGKQQGDTVAPGNGISVSSIELQLAASIRLLDEDQQKIVREFIAVLLKASQRRQCDKYGEADIQQVKAVANAHGV